MTLSKETEVHKTHHLKIYPQHFSAVLTGVKRAELRKNDRDYRVGDILHLMETPKGSSSTTGEFVNAVVTHIADVSDWLPGYVLLSIERELLERRERDKQETGAEIYAELHRLREESRGPDGFSTWKDAAIAERLARVKYETLLNQRSYDIDYLTAMAAFHSDDWHKMSPITAYMHGWNARSTDPAAERDARRYRFLRDKDAFGADNESGLVSWDELTELDLCEFDAAVDARLVATGFDSSRAAPPAQVVTSEPVRYMNSHTGACYTQEQQPDAATDPAVYIPLYAAPPAPVVPDECVDNQAVCWMRSRSLAGNYRDDWNDCRAAMLQSFGNSEQLKSPAVPDGWVAVPVKPTNEMLGQLHPITEADCPDCGKRVTADCEDNVLMSWQEMLAAAPKQESE